ncbi:hypothetical protein HZZ02_07130 [Streptococcus danieliae]|nr:hypothetical protein [Streptococcus danieliae]
MQKAEIKFMPVRSDEKPEWGVAVQLTEKFVDLSEPMANKYLDEMQKKPYFDQFVCESSTGLRFVNFEAFEVFMKWKAQKEMNILKELSNIFVSEWRTFQPIGVPLDADYCGYESIGKFWVDFKKGYAKQVASEMRENKDFAPYILNTSHKGAFFNLIGLRYFMIWKSRNRFKSKKETLAEMLENIKAEEMRFKDIAS